MPICDYCSADNTDLVSCCNCGYPDLPKLYMNAPYTINGTILKTNEKFPRVFHGTTLNNMKSIKENGFHIGEVIAGNSSGSGIYFGTNLEYCYTHACKLFRDTTMSVTDDNHSIAVSELEVAADISKYFFYDKANFDGSIQQALQLFPQEVAKQAQVNALNYLADKTRNESDYRVLFRRHNDAVSKTQKLGFISHEDIYDALKEFGYRGVFIGARDISGSMFLSWYPEDIKLKNTWIICDLREKNLQPSVWSKANDLPLVGKLNKTLHSPVAMAKTGKPIINFKEASSIDAFKLQHFSRFSYGV